MSGSRTKNKPKSKAKKAAHELHSDSGTGRAGAHRSGRSAGSRLGPFYASGPVFGLGAPVQKKLVIGRANDPYEQEADMVAERVTRGAPAPAISPLGPGGLDSVSQRQEEDTEDLLQETSVQRQEEEEEPIQTQESGQPARGESETEASGKSPRERVIEEGERRLDEIEEKVNELEEGVGRARERMEELQPWIVIREKREALMAKVTAFDPDSPGKTSEQVNDDIVAILDDCSALQQWGDDDAPSQAMASVAKKLIPGIIQSEHEFSRTRSYDSALKLVKNIERYQYLGGEGFEDGVLNEAIEVLQRQQERQPRVTVQQQTEEETEEPVQKLDSQASGEREASSGVEVAIQRARGGGQPLERGIRSQMEPAFGADFSRVRVHTDAGADALTRSLGAHAFTSGQDIFFRLGTYDMGSLGGQKLLAHELTHTQQQERAAGSTGITNGTLPVRQVTGSTILRQSSNEPIVKQGGGGYKYEQHPDGTIVIIDAPAGKGVGARLPAGNKLNEVITAEIGPYPAAEPSALAEGQKAPPVQVYERVTRWLEDLGAAASSEVSDFGRWLSEWASSDATKQAQQIDPNNHQSRDSFVVGDKVETVAKTDEIIDAIYMFYPKKYMVVGGYVSNSKQFWKMNWHWENLQWVIDDCLTLDISDKHKKCLKAIKANLDSNKPTHSGYRTDDKMGDTPDNSTTEEGLKRWEIVRQAKKDFKQVLDAANLAAKSNRPEESIDLSWQYVAKPGTSKHGVGYALDIRDTSGEKNNADIIRISELLGATYTLDEVYHAHVEFAKPVKKK